MRVRRDHFRRAAPLPDVRRGRLGAVELEPVLPGHRSGLTEARASRLQTEEALHLVPDGETEEEKRARQQDEDEPEAQVREMPLADAPLACEAFRTLEPVGPRDRRRVDGG